MKRRNSQFGVFFGHGSVGEHQASVGAEENAVAHRGDRAAARRPPARGEERGLGQPAQALAAKNHSSAGSQGEMAGGYFQEAFQQGMLQGGGNQLRVPARCRATPLSGRDFHLLSPAACGAGTEPGIQLQTDEKTNQVRDLIQPSGQEAANKEIRVLTQDYSC